MVDITIRVAMISPNGKTTINAHPDSVEYLKSKGWNEEAIPSKDKLKSSSKTKTGE